AIVDAIWGEEPPASATGTLQSYVSRLRRRLGDQASLVWDDAGYRLDVAPAAVDHLRVQSLTQSEREPLDGARQADESAAFRDAAALCRGPALVEFLDRAFARSNAARLEEQRVVAIEDRIDANLRLGRHANRVGELTELVQAHPLRESL